MKRYRFPLEQVRRVRSVQEERARAELRAAQGWATAAGAAVAERRAVLGAHAGPVDAVPTSAWLCVRAAGAALAAGVRAAEASRDEAEAVVAARRAEWSAAASRVTALDRLDERRRAEHAVAARRDEDRLVDDIVVARAGRRR